jgi:predicted RNA-binding protein associated with RNAse of E/G family
MGAGGTYDGLGVAKEAGDEAVTTLAEGRWWYPTVYRNDEGDHKGTYVNVCTPIEVFPTAVRYVDLYVDVVKHADGRVERLDDDELADAIDRSAVEPELGRRARTVASSIERALREDA